jgi:hypothetical protein
MYVTNQCTDSSNKFMVCLMNVQLLNDEWCVQWLLLFVAVVVLLQVPEFRVAMDIQTDKFDDLYKKLKPKVGGNTSCLWLKKNKGAPPMQGLGSACELGYSLHHRCSVHQHGKHRHKTIPCTCRWTCIRH